MNETGIYVYGAFIQTSIEKNGKGEKAAYALVATGGRRGAISIKYDPADDVFSDFFGDCAMGDFVLARVSLTAFKDAVYYSLQSIVHANPNKGLQEAS